MSSNKSHPVTRHVGAQRRGGIAPTHEDGRASSPVWTHRKILLPADRPARSQSVKRLRRYLDPYEWKVGFSARVGISPLHWWWDLPSYIFRWKATNVRAQLQAFYHRTLSHAFQWQAVLTRNFLRRQNLCHKKKDFLRSVRDNFCTCWRTAIYLWNLCIW